MTTTTIKTQEQLAKLLYAHQTVLLIFTASWCGMCKVVKNILAENVQKENIPAHAALGEVDVDVAEEIATTYNIKALPTVLLFKASAECVRFFAKDFKESSDWLSKVQ